MEGYSIKQQKKELLAVYHNFRQGQYENPIINSTPDVARAFRLGKVFVFKSGLDNRVYSLAAFGTAIFFLVIWMVTANLPPYCLWQIDYPNPCPWAVEAPKVYLIFSIPCAVVGTAYLWMWMRSMVVVAPSGVLVREIRTTFIPWEKVVWIKDQKLMTSKGRLVTEVHLRGAGYGILRVPAHACEMPELLEKISDVPLNVETAMTNPDFPGWHVNLSQKGGKEIKLRLLKLERMHTIVRQYWESAQIAQNQTLIKE